jgi:hypothetical protein
MQLEAIRAEIEYMRRQIQRQRKDIQSLERAAISAKSPEELLSRICCQRLTNFAPSGTGR